jgi:hypothetical protein
MPLVAPKMKANTRLISYFHMLVTSAIMKFLVIQKVRPGLKEMAGYEQDELGE